MNKKTTFLLFLRLFFAALFFLAFCLTFSGFSGFSPVLRIQLFPAIDRKAWGIVAAILILTVLSGRFYCSVLCPFGILQDIIAFISRRKSRIERNHSKPRYILAGLAFGSFAAGNTLIIAALDPYSNSGRIIAFIKNPSFFIGGIILAFIVFLTVWKKRIFCTSLCPVGTLLGICAKISPFKWRLSDKCVKCQKCVSVCPAGCIDPDTQTLDNERCIRCLKCTAVCPANAIGIKKPSSPSQETNLSRRGFLTGALTAAAAAGAGAVFARQIAVTEKKDRIQPICPPGAATAQEFASKCTHCQLCVINCKGKVLRPASGRYQTVHLEYGENYCLYDCHKCSSICPTGALTALTLTEKQHRRIGLAEFSTDKCVGCGLCADVCPRNAINISDINGEDKAVLASALCIGCGACVSACPLPEKAVRVLPAVIQSQI